jgi:hypothetical protein
MDQWSKWPSNFGIAGWPKLLSAMIKNLKHYQETRITPHRARNSSQDSLNLCFPPKNEDFSLKSHTILSCFPGKMMNALTCGSVIPLVELLSQMHSFHYHKETTQAYYLYNGFCLLIKQLTN